MKQARVFKKHLFFALSVLSFFLFAVQANAQNQPTAPDTQKQANKTLSAEKIADADVLIIANVTARELKFDVVPAPKVEFPGTKERKTVWEADRQNLPRPVEPGVTYRNIGIQLRIASRFADIERIVAEALGEVPLGDDKPLTPAESKQPVNAAKPGAADSDKKTEPAPRSN